MLSFRARGRRRTPRASWACSPLWLAGHRDRRPRDGRASGGVRGRHRRADRQPLRGAELTCPTPRIRPARRRRPPAPRRSPCARRPATRARRARWSSRASRARRASRSARRWWSATRASAFARRHVASSQIEPEIERAAQGGGGRQDEPQAGERAHERRGHHRAPRHPRRVPHDAGRPDAASSASSRRSGTTEERRVGGGAARAKRSPSSSSDRSEGEGRVHHRAPPRRRVRLRAAAPRAHRRGTSTSLPTARRSPWSSSRATSLRPTPRAWCASPSSRFVTEIGTRTSHTAIMARALEIPAVVGVGRRALRPSAPATWSSSTACAARSSSTRATSPSKTRAARRRATSPSLAGLLSAREPAVRHARTASR